ncbi:long-chain fatty acid-CoA ligase [Coemansia javaensis]|uniref:Long-chain fatty acid-CoA ligase n=1 Tax=Coemansia javaensis TaxID=2761396 RepID=A0A9W8H9L1_9FUNG|nr:long-chain fatty acid-CoA ligase [Coemansia javaensis]
MDWLYSLCMPGTGGGGGETATRRHPLAAAGGLIDSAPPGVGTVYDAFLYRLRVEPDKETMGRRRVLRVVDEARGDGRVWSRFELGDYEWTTYREAAQTTRALGAGLAELVAGGAPRVAIHAPTSREWTLCMLACYSQAMQVVTAYDTLGDDGLAHAVAEAGASLLLVKADQLPAVARIAPRIRAVRAVVYYQDHYGMPPAACAALDAVRGQFAHVMAMDDVEALGRARPRDVRVARREDTALVMYTSGTTGAPRGALIAHGGLLAICGAIHALVPAYIDYAHDRVLSYLPLSHVLAFFVETYCIYSGIKIGYGAPRTLTEANMVPGCPGDIRALRPAVMLGVPQVWNTIRATILRQVDQRPWAVRQLFHAAVELKTWLVRRGLPTGLLDCVVFKKTRAATGGRLKIAITGGAQINPHVQKLVAAAVCPMIHGYGLTEASGLVAVQIPGDTTLGNVGPPVPSVEMKLVDVPEAGYFARDGRGEVCVRGPSVFQGYLGDDPQAREAVTEDGWLRTGDIGEWTPRGQLAIIDRRKNLVKLVSGEYVALEALESAYSSSKYVTNICVVADAHMARPCAIVNMDPAAVAHWAAEARLCAADDVADSRPFREMVYGDLLAVARQCRLQRQQILADIRIDPDLWTPENGMLTAASKLRRAAIHKRNAKRLQEIAAVV